MPKLSNGMLLEGAIVSEDGERVETFRVKAPAKLLPLKARGAIVKAIKALKDSEPKPDATA